MLAFFFTAVLSACSVAPVDGSQPGDFDSAAELTATPFHPQERYQCGPASLLTLLQASGARTDMDTLVRRVYLPGRHGSLQAEMLAASRGAGRIPYRIDGTLAAVSRELAAGRPVLVLQNLGVSWLPRWHYAVVIGLDAEAGEVVLRSGTERRRVTALRAFLHTWERSDYWGFVALRATELPASVDRQRWFRSIAALEETGQPALAGQAWERAAREWPDATVALFGLANSHYRNGRWEAAAEQYRRLLDTAPQLAMAHNNLALALMQMQRYDDALAQAESARQLAGDDAALLTEIASTRDQIRAARTAR